MTVLVQALHWWALATLLTAGLLALVVSAQAVAQRARRSAQQRAAQAPPAARDVVGSALRPGALRP